MNKKHLTAAILAAVLITAIAPSTYAADTRVGRVLQLAEHTCFGYTQIIEDRLCLFDETCTQIADFPKDSEVTSKDYIYVVDDGTFAYFFTPDAEILVTLPSWCEYKISSSFYGQNPIVTARTDDGYIAYCYDGVVTSVTDEEIAAEYPDLEFDYVRYFIDNSKGIGYFSGHLQYSSRSIDSTRAKRHVAERISYLGEYSDGLLAVGNPDFFGYVDSNGDPVITITGKPISGGTFYVNKDFYDGFAPVLALDKNGFMKEIFFDTNSNQIFDTSAFLSLYATHKGNLFTCTRGVREFVVYREEGDIITAPVIPADTGEPATPYYTTDIKVLIDGDPIQAYAIDGRMLIPVEDLAYHGFKVGYVEGLRMVIADRIFGTTGEASPIEDTDGSVGELAGYTQKSDISAYINGRYVETEAIDGKLLVEAEALCEPVGEDDPDYRMLHYMGLSAYLMDYDYSDEERTLYITTYNG